MLLWSTSGRRTNTELDKGSTLQPGDLQNLKKIMAALKTVKEKGTDIQYQIDQMGETLRYMRLFEMGKLDPLDRKLNDVSEVIDWLAD